MAYISARYAPPNSDPQMQPKPGEPRMVIATDDQGGEWWLNEDSQVGDWLRYVEAGGTVMASKTPEPMEGKSDG